MKTVEYLDAVKKKLEISSDYALQTPLQVTKQAVSRYRNGGTFDHLVAARVARILGLAELKVIADMELERAQSEEHRELWKRLARRVAGVLLPAAIAAVASPAADAAVRSACCVLCKIPRRWLGPLAPFFPLPPDDDELTA